MHGESNVGHEAWRSKGWNGVRIEDVRHDGSARALVHVSRPTGKKPWRGEARGILPLLLHCLGSTYVTESLMPQAYDQSLGCATSADYGAILHLAANHLMKYILDLLYFLWAMGRPLPSIPARQKCGNHLTCARALANHTSCPGWLRPITSFSQHTIVVPLIVN